MRTPCRAPETHFNFELGAWVVGGKFIRCGMRGSGPCQCYGCRHEGERETSEMDLGGDIPETLLLAPSQLSDLLTLRIGEKWH